MQKLILCHMDSALPSGLYCCGFYQSLIKSVEEITGIHAQIIGAAHAESGV